MDTIIAGSLAALSVDILIYPLDTIKTRLQDPNAQTVPSSKNGTSVPWKLALSGLYQGVGSVVAVTLPAAALFFTTYEGVKNVLLPPGWDDSGAGTPSGTSNTDPRMRRARIVGSHAIASVTAELASCVILTPAEMIKQRAQVARSQVSPNDTTSNSMNGARRSSPTVQAFRETFLTAANNSTSSRQLGKTLWRGYVALASRNLPYTAMQFPLYEHFRAELSVKFGLGKPTADGQEKKIPAPADTHSSESSKRSVSNAVGELGVDSPSAGSGTKMTRNQEILWSGASSALAGAGAGSLAALVTTPIDVAKTRIMLSKSSSAVDGRTGAPPGVSATLRSIWLAEGLKGVMKGGLLRSAWTAIGAGVYLSSYETGRIWVREHYL